MNHLFFPSSDPSLVAVDGSFQTAKSLANSKAWGSSMIDMLDAKTNEIDTKKPKAELKFQVRHFPAKFSHVPPVILMEAASRISTQAAANGGGGENQTEFDHWIKMIKSYAAIWGKKGLHFDHPLRSQDVRCVNSKNFV